MAQDRTPVTRLMPSSVSLGLSSLGIDCSVGSNFFPLTHRKIRIGERTFDRGLSMTADNEIVYGLDGRHTRFEAWAGTDWETNTRPNARVKLSVLAGGYAVPVTFAKSGTVAVTLRYLRMGGWKAEELVPGETAWKPLIFKSQGETTSFTVPTSLGAGLVRFSRPRGTADRK